MISINRIVNLKPVSSLISIYKSEINNTKPTKLIIFNCNIMRLFDATFLFVLKKLEVS